MLHRVLGENAASQKVVPTTNGTFVYISNLLSCEMRSAPEHEPLFNE